MAGKTNITDYRFSIFINNDNAKRSLIEMEKVMQGYEAELKNLVRENKKDSQEYRDKKKVMDEHNVKMVEMRKQAGLQSLSLKELRGLQAQLNNELARAIPGTAHRKKLEAEFQAVSARVNELKVGAQNTGMSFGKLADGFNKYFAIVTAGIAAFSGVMFSLKELISGNAKLSDSLADVRKTTGLTLAEVKRLYSELGKLNTRTSRSELMELATVAGKLGYSLKSEVLGFVKAADQINVALAKDLGGSAEDAINSLGKLADIFKIKDQFGIEQAMLKSGSAINALGAASSANEGYIVEFTKRLGGIAPQAGISIQNIMGLGATLDQLGQQTETSSTAVTQLITKMFQNTAEYAKIAGLNVEDFGKKLKTDANSALIMFLEGLQKNKGGLQELAEKFKDMGIDGSRAISVIGVLANNTKLLTDTQRLSNLEFEKGTSLTNEFNIKNANMAGNLEKIGKGLRAMFVNSAITSGLEKIVGLMAKWFDIPLSAKMSRESIQVNALASELTDANLTMEQRNKLYGELNAIAPTVLAGIDKEAIAYDKLASNLEKYNEQMVNRIIIQKQQEKIDSANEVLAENREKRLQAEAELRTNIMTSIQLFTKTDPDRAKKMQGIMSDENKTLEEKLNLIEKEFVGNNMKYNLLRSFWKEEKDAQVSVNKLLSEKNSLMSDLGISNTSPTSTSTGEAPKADPDKEALDIEEKKKKAKEYADYLKKIQQDLQAALIQGIQNQQERELKMAELDYKKKLEAIKGHSKDEEALRLAYKSEFERKVQDINKKYSEEEVKKQQDQAKKLFDAEKAKWEARIKADDKGSAEWFLDAKQFLDLQMQWEMDQVGIVENAEQLKLEIRQKYLLLYQNMEEDFTGTGKSSKSTEGKSGQSLVEKSGVDKSDGGLGEKIMLLQMARDQELEIAQDSADRQKQIWQEYYDALGQMITDNVNNIISVASQVLSQLSNLNSAINDYENAQLAKDQSTNDKKKANLKKRLDSGLITQKDYDKQVSKLDTEMDAKKKKLEIDQAKRQHKIAIFNAIIGLAQAVMNGLNTQPFMPLGIIMGALAAVLGGIQLGYVLSAPVPTAATGRYDVIGQGDGKSYNDVPYEKSPKTGIYSKPTLFAETGKEIIIDPGTTRNIMMNYPEIIDAINMARVPQRASGSYVETRSGRTDLYSGGRAAGPDYEKLNTTLDRLNDHLDNGVNAKISYDHLIQEQQKVDAINKDVSR